MKRPPLPTTVAELAKIATECEQHLYTFTKGEDACSNKCAWWRSKGIITRGHEGVCFWEQKCKKILGDSFLPDEWTVEEMEGILQYEALKRLGIRK